MWHPDGLPLVSDEAGRFCSGHVQQRLEVRRAALTETAHRRRAYWKAIEEDVSAGVALVSSQQIMTPTYHVA